MRRNPYIFLFPFFFLLLANAGFAQMENLPIDRWIKDLSVKTDIRAEKYLTVLAQCKALDSLTFCGIVRALKEKGPRDNRRFQIRLLTTAHCTMPIANFTLPINQLFIADC